MSKKNTKMNEPQYMLSATNMKTLNYKVYYMKPLEKILTFLVAFVVGAAVGFMFYGGIGKNEFGEPTTLTYSLNIIIPSIVGLIAGVKFLPIRTESIRTKRKSMLRRQFRDMLDSLNTSLGAGKNVNDSFFSVYQDMKIQYEEDAFIIKELEIIITGINNNIPIESLLEDFGYRSGIEDINSFASVFKISYRKGGNIKDIIRDTHNILSQKLEINEDIETVLTSNKMEQNIMIVMPVLIISVIKLLGSDFTSKFVTPIGVFSTTISIVTFVIAYYVGKAVMNVKL